MQFHPFSYAIGEKPGPTRTFQARRVHRKAFQGIPHSDDETRMATGNGVITTHQNRLRSNSRGVNVLGKSRVPDGAGRIASRPITCPPPPHTPPRSYLDTRPHP